MTQEEKSEIIKEADRLINLHEHFPTFYDSEKIAHAIIVVNEKIKTLSEYMENEFSTAPIIFYTQVRNELIKRIDENED